MEILTLSMSLTETIGLLPIAEKPPVSRFALGSPCRFVKSIDMAVHIVLPETIEDVAPNTARYLRSTSPRWGRSWREW